MVSILYNIGPVQVESAIFFNLFLELLAGEVLFPLFGVGVAISWKKWCWKGRDGS